jgi:hypothetical protein
MLLEPTYALWEQIKAREELSGFILIGGSALALRIQHRRSEDLDFAWPHGTLPRAELQKLIASVPGTGFIPNANEAQLLEASEACLELDDYRQDYIANGVKVTFFRSPEAESRLLARGKVDPARVAEIGEIFVLKALASADRSKSRDWFDLYFLFSEHGYSWDQFHQVFVEFSDEGKYEIAARRLCSGVPSSTDEGYESLVDHPPTIEEMRDTFIELKRRFDQGER